MKSEKYIDVLVGEVHDEALKARLREELEEHWQDLVDERGMQNEPKEIFGDAVLIAKQTNVTMSPLGTLVDIAMSIGIGFMTLLFLTLLSAFVTVSSDTFDSLTVGAAQLVGAILGIVTWGGGAYYGYLRLHARLIERYGLGASRSLLLACAFWLPWAFSITLTTARSVAVLMSQPPSMALDIRLSILSMLVAGGIMFGLYLKAAQVARGSFSAVVGILERMTRSIPLVVFMVIVAGTSLLMSSANEPDSVVSIIGISFAIPVLMLYFSWGALSMLFAWMAGNLGLVGMTGFWLSTALAAVLGIIVPMTFLVGRKRPPVLFQFFAAIIAPFFFILPLFVSHDIPVVTWHAPLVWDWDEVERKQLNIFYPWAAPLMRQNDGVNIEYRAVSDVQSIDVSQGGDTSFVITRNAKPIVRHTERKSIAWYDHEAYGPTPQGFSCDGEPLEELTDIHGMFGIVCKTLAYNGVLVAEIAHGNLIDLDLTEDGLLAVSINMGSYDPTYVYVVDLGDGGG